MAHCVDAAGPFQHVSLVFRHSCLHWPRISASLVILGTVGHEIERHLKQVVDFLSKQTSNSHDIGDVSNDHEIQLGIGHYGRLPTYRDYHKNHLRKNFTAILGHKRTKCELQYCKEATKCIKCVNFHSVNFKLQGNFFQCGFSGSP